MPSALTNKILNFSNMTFAIVVWCYCYCYSYYYYYPYYCYLYYQKCNPPCTLHSVPARFIYYIYMYICRLHELRAHKSSLLSPLSKLWFPCTSRQLLSFKLNCVLVWLTDFLRTTLAINVFSLLLSFSVIGQMMVVSKPRNYSASCIYEHLIWQSK